MAAKFKNGIDVVPTVTATAAAIGDTPLIVKATSGQTGRLQQWQDSSGGLLAGITSSGGFGTSNRITAGSATVNTTGVLVVLSSSDQVLSVVRGVGASGNPTQTTDLQQWQTYNGTTATTVAAIGARGALQLPYTSVSGNTTLDYSHYTVAVSATATITLPAASTTASAAGVTGRIYNIKNTGTGTVTIARSGSDLIDGAASIILSSQYQSVTIQSTGTGWIVL